MSSFVSRWVVLHRHSVDASDLDAEGVLRDDVLARWIEEARDVYLERCTVFTALAGRSDCVVRSDDRAMPTGADLGRPTSVAVSGRDRGSSDVVHDGVPRALVRIRR